MSDTEIQVQQDEAVQAEAGTESDEAATAEGRNRRKTRVGTVVSNKTDKTVTVMVERRFPHPLYGKGVRRTKKYHAHDEKNEFQTGDVVKIMETRPLSKTKRWRVVELIERPA